MTAPDLNSRLRALADEIKERDYCPPGAASIALAEAADALSRLAPGGEMLGPPSLHEEVVSDARKLAHEIYSDVMAGEDEIAAAIEAGFVFRERRQSAEIARLRADLAAANAARKEAAETLMEVSASSGMSATEMRERVLKALSILVPNHPFLSNEGERRTAHDRP
jgi:hypothetical protein